MGEWRKNSLLDLQLGIADHDATNSRTLDSASGKIHASFGAGAAAPVKIPGQRGYTFDGAADYMTGLTQSVFNQARFALACVLMPTFAHDDGAAHFIFDTTNGARYMVSKSAANTLDVHFGNTSVLSIAAATFGPYWKRNQYNYLVVTGTTASNQAVLNETSVGTSATAWAAANPANYWIGCRYDTTLFFAGNKYQLEAMPLRLTMTQMLDWTKRAMARINSL